MERVSGQAIVEHRPSIRRSGPTHASLASELVDAMQLLESAGVQAVQDVAFGAEELAHRAGVEQAMALAIREAVVNIARHSRATRAIIRAWPNADNGDAILDIMDDGQGFDACAEGQGLSSVRECVESLHGRMWVGSSPGGRGTRLAIILPTRSSSIG